MNKWEVDEHEQWSERWEALTSYLFTPLFMFLDLSLIHFAPPPRILIHFKKIANDFNYFCILLCICYCFSDLIGLLSVT